MGPDVEDYGNGGGGGERVPDELVPVKGPLTSSEWEDTRKVLATVIDKFLEALKEQNKDEDIALAVVAWRPGYPSVTSYSSTAERPESKKALKRTVMKL